MSKTISFHNGSVWSRGHNVRDERYVNDQNHIDQNLSKNNITIVDTSVREAYEKIFGNAVKAYNENQKRKDRKIKDYYDKIVADKQKHPVYECIVQIGDRLTTGIEAEKEIEVLKEFAEKWKERNPCLKLIGAYIHADETDGTVHLHCDYIPVASCERGMSIQNSLDRALKEQEIAAGNSIHATSQILWEKKEREALYELCVEKGIDVTLEKKEKGRKHQDKDEYIAEQKRMSKELENAKQAHDAKMAEYADAVLEVEMPKGTGIGKNLIYNAEEVQQLAEKAAKGQAVYEDSIKRQNEADEIIGMKDEIISKAKTEADEIIETAKKKTAYVAEQKNGATKKIKELNAKIAEKEVKFADKKAELSRIEEHYANKKAKLDEVEARLKAPMQAKDDKIKELQERSDRWKTAYNTAKDEIKKLDKEIGTCYLQIANKDKEIQLHHRPDECSEIWNFICNLFKPDNSSKFKVEYNIKRNMFELIGEDPQPNELSTEIYGTAEHNAYELTIKMMNRTVAENEPELEKQLSIWDKFKEWGAYRFLVQPLLNGINSVFGAINALRSKIQELTRTITENKETYRVEQRYAHEQIKDMAKAVGLLIYNSDNSIGSYGENCLNKKQADLIQAVSDHAENVLRNDGYTEYADDVLENIGISQAIADVYNQINGLQQTDELQRSDSGLEL